jgi:hypothetical protein
MEMYLKYFCSFGGDDVVVHSTYCQGDKILTNEVGGTCGIMGKRRVLTRI